MLTRQTLNVLRVVQLNILSLLECEALKDSSLRVSVLNNRMHTGAKAPSVDTLAIRGNNCEIFGRFRPVLLVAGGVPLNTFLSLLYWMICESNI